MYFDVYVQKYIVFYSLVLVYHLGGRTLQVTLISVNSGIYRIMDSIFDNSIGGEKFDDALVDHLATEFKRLVKIFYFVLSVRIQVTYGVKLT